jgi:thymidylate synthase
MNSTQLEVWERTGIMPYHTEPYIPFHADYEYLRWINPILDSPQIETRTKYTNQILFGIPQSVFDLRNGDFPLLTTKKIFFKGVKVETLWYLRGETHIKYLKEHGVKIWDEWVKEETDMEVGPIYGPQWVTWNNIHGDNINQIQKLVDEIKRAPRSKGLFVTSWNPAELGFNFVKLRPCHGIFHCNIDSDGFLNMKMYQRSADMFLGVPFNIASYALLLMMLAQVTGLKPGRMIHTYGDAHIYENHVEQLKIQLQREPMALPKLELNPDIKNIFDFTLDDITLRDYNSHGKLTGEVAV